MESYGFFNGGTEYGQEEFNRYFDHIYHSGISADDSGNMRYKMDPGRMSVTVKEGFAIVKGFYHYNDSAKTLSVEPSHNLPYLFRVVIRLNIAEGRVNFAILKGAPGSSPLAPALTRSDTVYELSLGTFKITPVGIVSLVMDDRFNPELCGVIRPRNLQEYAETMKSLQKQWDEWFKSQQGQGQRNIYVQSSTPSGAVSGSIWIDG